MRARQEQGDVAKGTCCWRGWRNMVRTLSQRNDQNSYVQEDDDEWRTSRGNEHG